MFFGSTRDDIIINIFLLFLALIFSIIISKKKKSLLLGVLLFSVLSNAIFYVDRFSPTFASYNIKWLIYFSTSYWPWINFVLLFCLVASKSQIKKIKSLEFLKPTKRKILYSLIPFAPIILLPVFWIKFPNILIFSIFIDIHFHVMSIIYGVVRLAAFPFEPILSHLEMWGFNSNQFNSFGSAYEISVPGMIVVAIFYAVLIYILNSIYAYKKSKA